MTDKKCPYCDFDEYDIIDKNEFAVILPDPNPLSKGHCVVTPLRHVSSFFDITSKEHQSLLTLLEIARHETQLRHQPDGFHIGFNDGEVFGQTSDHFHIHVIPYYKNQPLKLDQRWGVKED